MRRLLMMIAIAVALLAGCNRGPQTYQVNGKVVFEDGAPLTTGGVVFAELTSTDAAGTNARGAIDEEGNFQLTTFNDKDGVLLGTHRFLVRADRDAEDYTKRGIIPRPVIDERFEDYDTAQLEFTIEEADTDVTLTVTKPGKKRSRK